MRSKEQTLAMRKKYLGLSLSLAYNEPLKIVRGKGQYLYDEKGKEYLDCVNNISHVGHCHPAVIQAAHEQNQLLNTNTRYLHDNIIELAEKLTAKLPKPLSVCHFVNSGSEANELALRMAATVTGNNNTIVLDHAYHGNTSSLISISPYKCNGRGGAGKPEHFTQAFAVKNISGVVTANLFNFLGSGLRLAREHSVKNGVKLIKFN